VRGARTPPGAHHPGLRKLKPRRIIRISHLHPKGRGFQIVKKDLKIRAPMIPKDNGFKKLLKDTLMSDNLYASHWVDAVIRTAYSIMENWRKRYLKRESQEDQAEG
jgi:hypothetical protein